MDDRSAMNLKSSDRMKQEIKYALILDLRGILYTIYLLGIIMILDIMK